jgi:hypothetical protein
MAITALALVGAGNTHARQGAATDPLVWCGLDYSMVKMIGTDGFRDPDKIFPGMLEAWNALFMKEMLPRLEKMAPSAQTDLKAVDARNAKASAKQIEHEDGTRAEKVDPSHITEADIAKAVGSYKLTKDTGLGLVFIVDRLVHAQKTGCLYVVFFDLASRKVVRSERICADAAGFGFRNFWFHPVKLAVEKLPKIYKQAKSTGQR